MKFAILDAHVREDHEFSSSKYQYLDDFLDKTFVTDYFLDRSSSSQSSASSSTTHATTKP
jgi:hypothetical protein